MSNLPPSRKRKSPPSPSIPGPRFPSPIQTPHAAYNPQFQAALCLARYTARRRRTGLHALGTREAQAWREVLGGMFSALSEGVSVRGGKVKGKEEGNGNKDAVIGLIAGIYKIQHTSDTPETPALNLLTHTHRRLSVQLDELTRLVPMRRGVGAELDEVVFAVYGLVVGMHGLLFSGMGDAAANPSLRNILPYTPLRLSGLRYWAACIKEAAGERDSAYHALGHLVPEVEEVKGVLEVEGGFGGEEWEGEWGWVAGLKVLRGWGLEGLEGGTVEERGEKKRRLGVEGESERQEREQQERERQEMERRLAVEKEEKKQQEQKQQQQQLAAALEKEKRQLALEKEEKERQLTLERKEKERQEREQRQEKERQSAIAVEEKKQQLAIALEAKKRQLIINKEEKEQEEKEQKLAMERDEKEAKRQEMNRRLATALAERKQQLMVEQQERERQEKTQQLAMTMEERKEKLVVERRQEQKRGHPASPKEAQIRNPRQSPAKPGIDLSGLSNSCTGLTPKNPFVTSPTPHPFVTSPMPHPFVTKPVPKHPFITNTTPKNPFITKTTPKNPFITKTTPKSPIPKASTPPNPFLTNRFLTNSTPTNSTRTNPASKNGFVRTATGEKSMSNTHMGTNLSVTNATPKSLNSTNPSPSNPFLKTTAPKSLHCTIPTPTPPFLKNTTPNHSRPANSTPTTPVPITPTAKKANTTRPSSSSTPTPQPTCRFFKTQACVHGSACKFAHSDGDFSAALGPGLTGSTGITASRSPLDGGSKRNPKHPPAPAPSSAPAPPSPQPCHFFQRGSCKNGASCRYVHGRVGEFGTMRDTAHSTPHRTSNILAQAQAAAKGKGWMKNLQCRQGAGCRNRKCGFGHEGLGGE
ncbi:hypothetical protein IAQ61_001536, partial [Plenodomus lingam]|uniref:uncharacterized protein n=1 Tax=Leptosphaeria maculans TaxID=5022 RepID=UPI003322F573